MEINPNITRDMDEDESDGCGGALCPQYAENTVMFDTVLYFGSLCSLISVVENLLIFIALIRSDKGFNTYFLYLLILALCDTFVCACYIPIIVIDQAKDHFELVWMARLWWTYICPLLTLCNVAMTASCYLMVSMQFERFLITVKCKLYSDLLKDNRVFLCCFALALAIAFKAPILLEFQIKQCANATGINERQVDVTDLVRSNHIYATFYKFWARNIFTVFLPFALLAYFNVGILLTLRNNQRKARLLRFAGKNQKAQVRAATRTFLLVVSTYLISNVLNVVVIAWEHIDMESLMGPANCQFYMIATDMVSLLTVLGCALRLPIYLLCNPELRLVITSRFCPRFCAACAAADDESTTVTSSTQFDNVAIYVALNASRLRISRILHRHKTPRSELTS